MAILDIAMVPMGQSSLSGLLQLSRQRYQVSPAAQSRYPPLQPQLLLKPPL